MVGSLNYAAFLYSYYNSHPRRQERRGIEQAPRRGYHRVRRRPPQHPRGPPSQEVGQVRVEQESGLLNIMLRYFMMSFFWTRDRGV